MHGPETSASGQELAVSPSDTFIIPGRIRYPSAKIGPNPELLDLNIARNLLDRKSLTDDPRHRQHALNFSSNHTEPSIVYSNSDFEDVLGRKQKWLADTYNKLAVSCGLSPAAPFRDHIDLTGTESAVSTVGNTKQRFWNKLSRASSLRDLRDNAEKRVIRKSSITNLLHICPKISLACRTLDDLYRLGGCSVVHLPAEYAERPLELPTCIAATANHLIIYGCRSPGLFRIPGQNTAVNGLYEHYVSQMHWAEIHAQGLHEAIGCKSLPSGTFCSTHDVASTFKKFLWDVPGGILGSVELYNALQEVEVMVDHNDFSTPNGNASLRVRLIALAISNVRSSRRIALISAVFGLLAFLNNDSNTQRKSMMDSNGFGIVFAPLLLGNLADKISLSESTTRYTPGIYVDIPKRTLMHRLRSSKRSKATDSNMNVQVRHNKRSIAIVEMLIRNWSAIVQRIGLAEPRSFSRWYSWSSLEAAEKPKVISRRGTSKIWRSQSMNLNDGTKSLGDAGSAIHHLAGSQKSEAVNRFSDASASTIAKGKFYEEPCTNVLISKEWRFQSYDSLKSRASIGWPIEKFEWTSDFQSLPAQDYLLHKASDNSLRIRKQNLSDQNGGHESVHATQNADRLNHGVQCESLVSFSGSHERSASFRCSYKDTSKSSTNQGRSIRSTTVECAGTESENLKREHVSNADSGSPDWLDAVKTQSGVEILFAPLSTSGYSSRGTNKGALKDMPSCQTLPQARSVANFQPEPQAGTMIVQGGRPRSLPHLGQMKNRSPSMIPRPISRTVACGDVRWISRRDDGTPDSKKLGAGKLPPKHESRKIVPETNSMPRKRLRPAESRIQAVRTRPSTSGLGSSGKQGLRGGAMDSVETLHAAITRLQQELAVKHEETWQLRQEIEAMRKGTSKES